jgi:peroxiredoxin
MKRSLAFFLLALLVVMAASIFWPSTLRAAPNTPFFLLDGSRAHTSDLRGKVLLLNFWATSCAICVAEMPEIVALHEKFKSRGFDTIAVAMRFDPPSYVVGFAQSRQLPFKVAIDNTGAVAQAWGDVRLTPTTFIVNRQGEIVMRVTGALDFTTLEALIEGLL